MALGAGAIGQALGGRNSTLARLWGWWREGLAGCIPAAVRTRIAAGDAPLAVRRSGDGWQINGEAGDPLRTEELALHLIERTAGRPRATVLQLESGEVLVTRVVLPRAAEENRREVLGFEMERRTPFRAEQVYFDYVAETGEADAQHVAARLFTTARAGVDAAIAELGRGHVEIAGVSVDGAPRSLNLLPVEKRPRGRSSAGLNLLLGLVLLGLVAAALALPVHQQGKALDAQAAQLAKAREQADAVIKLREEASILERAQRFAIERRIAVPHVPDLLLEVTHLLPDSTWVQQISYEKGRLELRGESSEAYALIPLLEASPLFEDVKFRSTVTQNTRTSRERFHIEMRARMGGELAPPDAPGATGDPPGEGR